MKRRFDTAGIQKFAVNATTSHEQCAPDPCPVRYRGVDRVKAPVHRFVRLGETERYEIRVWIDGRPSKALEGDTLLVALLSNTGHLRHSEFSDGVRSGFCLMGACQDCWVRDEQAQRLRACSTPARDGMRILTSAQEAEWAKLA
jgi:D-hydroxyproline dehydrogenase subunit gamma